LIASEELKLINIHYLETVSHQSFTMMVRFKRRRWYHWKGEVFLEYIVPTYDHPHCIVWDIM